MKNNYYFSTCKPILLVGLLFMSLLGYAQTFTPPTSATSTAAVPTASQAADGNYNTSATISSSSLGNNRYVDLNWATTHPAGSKVFIKTTSETTLLRGLLGGGLGNVVGNLAAILLDGQDITVTAYDGTTARNALTLNGNFNNESSVSLKLVQNAAGEYMIRYIPNGTFNRVRVTNTRTGLSGLAVARTINVFEAYILTNVPACGVANYTSYTGGGLLAADITAGAGNQNGHLAIDNSPTTFSTLSPGTVGIAAFAEQQFYYEGTNLATDRYAIRVSVAPALISAGLLNNVSIRGYGANNQVVYDQPINSLLNLELLNILNSDAPVTLSAAPGVVISRIGLRVSGLADVNVLNPLLRIYSVSKSNFTLNVTGAGDYEVGQTATLTATATTGCATSSYTYSWTNSAGTVVSSSASYNAPTTTPGTYTYTVTATDNFGNRVTQTANVTVLPALAGTITGGGVVCYGDVPGNLTVTGYRGNIIRWEVSTDPAFTTPVVINTTSPTLNGSQIGNIIQTTYVRVYVGYATAPTQYVFASATFTVNSTTWNGTAWSAGVPTLDTMIFISGNYTLNTNLDGCALQVINGAAVTIPSGNTVQLRGSIRVLDGSVTFENNAHLIQLSDAVNQGNVTFIRNSSSLFRFDYTLWSSPASGAQTLDEFSPLTLPDRFYEYRYGVNTAGQPFEGYYRVNAETTTFEPGKSFLIRMPDALPSVPGYSAITAQTVFQGIFSGVPNNGLVLKALSTEGNRFTAVGNPYPSPINVRAFIDLNAPALADGYGLYFWRKKNNTNATSYATMTRDTYVSNPATGGKPGEDQYGGQISEQYYTPATAANWIINPGQGFIVKSDAATTTPTLQFNNAMRRGLHNNQFFKSAAPGTDEAEMNSQYFLDITGDVDAARIAMVYSSTATTGLDKMRDAVKLSDAGIISMYTIAENKNLVVQARPFTETDVVQLGYKAPEAKEYTLSLYSATGIFAEGQKIYLVDKVEGITRNITSGTYTFTTEAGTFNDRFELIYTNTTLDTDNPQVLASEVIIYRKNNVINIDAGSTLINSVNIYDIRGSRIYSQDGINATSTAADRLNAQQQVLIVEVNTVKGTVSKKVVF